MLRKSLALLVVAALVTSGCASTSGGRVPVTAPTVADPSMMSEYVQRLPAGARVKIERTNGESMRATLMKATAKAMPLLSQTMVWHRTGSAPRLY